MSSSSNILEECAAYFKKEHGFDRCFAEMRKKWKSYGKPAGKINLKAAAEHEKRAIGGFLGRTFWDADLVFSFSDFEKALGETRFREVPLPLLLEGYFGEKLVTNQGEKALEERRKEEFWNRIVVWLEERQEPEETSGALAWIYGMMEERQYGYSTVMGLWKNDERTAEITVRNVCEAYFLVMRAKEDGIPLAVLAARVTGNPHYFDRGQIAAALLLHILCHAGGRAVPRDAAGVHEVYGDSGIVVDEIASTVAFYGLHMRKAGTKNPILEAFCTVGEPGVLSLANLAGAETAWGEGAWVYVVENEMVFSYLVKRCQEMPVTLLCTSGQLSCAAQRLIRMLCEGGAKICYSGDMDPEGIGIADRLWKKYPRSIRIWRMEGKDYLDALSEERIEEWRLKKLQGVEHPMLRDTAEHVRQVGKAAYQENILDRLARDILLQRTG